MKGTITLTLILLSLFTLKAQNGTYDLRLSNEQINYSTSMFYFDLEIKASTSGSQFHMANQNYCISFNSDAFASNFTQLVSANMTGLVAQEEYSTMTLYSSPDFSVQDTVFCYSVSRIEGDGFYVDVNTWTNIARFGLKIIDMGGTGTVKFQNANQNPATSVSEWSSSSLIPAAEGFLYDLKRLQFQNLPIELTRFTADVISDREVLLTWQTQTEINNDFFTVERSMDGDSYEHLGTIDGAGNSEELVNYAWSDMKPLTGKSYYRLKQTDIDGEASYSEVVSVFISSKFEDEITLFPNPTVDHVRVNFENYPGESIIIEVFNLMGQKIQSEVKNISENQFREISIGTDHLPVGNYIIRISDLDSGNYSATARFEKI